MKQLKRLTSLVLALVMLFTLAAPGAWTVEVRAAEHPHDHDTAYQCGDLNIEVSTVQGSPLTLNENEEETKFYAPADAALLMRPEIVSRSEVITAYVYTDSFDGTEESARDLAIQIAAYAMDHTGVPNEGDYLLWNVVNLGANMQHAEDEGIHYFIFEYYFTYATTAEQEAAMDTAVEALLAELNVAEADNYTKLKAVYDYICANVAYADHEESETCAQLHSAYSALVNGTATCEGYAVLMYRLALELGVDCLVIPGTLDGNDHVWNIANIGDKYYNLDATLDAGETDYGCFLIGTANFTDHVRDESYTGEYYDVYYPVDEADYVPSICEHTYESAVTTESTCTAEGVKTITCTICGDSYTEAIPALGHTMGEAATTAPTCTAEGVSAVTCTVCGVTITETTPALGHTWDEGLTTEATCTAEGCTTYTCTVCGETSVENVVPALGHNFDAGTITVEPTCTTEGVKTYNCATCGKTINEAVPVTEHPYDEGLVTTAPTCTAEGVMTYTCTGCGVSYTEVIPMTEHTYDEGAVSAPTCTEQGCTTYTCTGCGISYQDLFVDALGHSYDDGEITRDPTCTATGTKTYTCARCANTINEIIDALGHTWDEGVVTLEPTCTEEGVMTYTCIHGDDSYTEAIPALGHTKDEGVVTQEATCTETGLMTYVCTVCAFEFTEEIPMIDHNYVDGKCTACGDIQLIAPTILSCYSKEQTSVKVTWTPVEGAEGYYLWRSTAPDDYNSWTKVKTINDGTADRYTNQGLTEGVTYYYAVQAFLTNDDGEVVTSEYSNMDYMPAAVVFDGPYSNATFRIRLRWNEVGGAHGYQIWRQNADGSWAIVKTLGDKGNELTDNQGATTAYSNTGLTAGEAYTYKMRAFMITEDGRKVFGAYSDEYTVAVMPETPVVTGTSPKATRAQLSWEALNGAAGYQIWMAESEDGEYKIVKSVTDGSTTYTKYDLTSGKTYYFKVRAYTEVEGKKTFGAYSEIVSVNVK